MFRFFLPKFNEGNRKGKGKAKSRTEKGERRKENLRRKGIGERKM